MFPFVMSDPCYFYPIDQVFGVMKVVIEVLDTLYFPVLPERFTTQKKMMYKLKTMTGTLSSVEIQKAVCVGNKILCTHNIISQRKEQYALKL